MARQDAAGIALEAINHVRDSGIDMVLVDTAGRMQDTDIPYISSSKTL